MNRPTLGAGLPTLMSLSHSRRDIVFQRPPHLLAPAAQSHQVLFTEQPIVASSTLVESRLDERQVVGVTVATPDLPRGLRGRSADGRASINQAAAWRQRHPAMHLGRHPGTHERAAPSRGAV